MTVGWEPLALVLGSYLIGSVPFGLLVSKFGHYPDPRVVGSGNIGFTNVLRISGKKAGVFTLLGDFGKGVLVAYLARHSVTSEIVILSMTFAVIAGHIFSIFLSFKGGKGVATALGAILGLEVGLGINTDPYLVSHGIIIKILIRWGIGHVRAFSDSVLSVIVPRKLSYFFRTCQFNYYFSAQTKHSTTPSRDGNKDWPSV